MSSNNKTTAMTEEKKTALVPKLRFQEFRGARGWEQKYIGDFFNVGSSKRVLQQDWIAQGIPFYRTRELVSLSKNEPFSSEVFISKSLFEEITQKYGVPQEGDFLVSGVGTLGISYLVKKGDEFYFKDGNVLWLSRKEGISSSFFKYCFESNFIQDQIQKQASVSTVGTYTIQNAKITRFYCPTAENEQQKIADCLSSVDELIAAQAQKVDALKTHKKGLMQQLFPREGETQPRLRFPEFKNTGKWEVQTLGELVEVASGQVDPTQPPYCDFPQVGSDNIESNSGKLVNVKSAGDKGVMSGNYVFDENDVLYSKIRPALNKAAAPAFEGICSADIYPIRPVSGGLLRSYLLYLLLSPEFLEYAIRNSERGKIPKINRDALLTYEGLIPLPAEQQRIASCLTSLDALITAESQQLEALKTHKKGLMQQLFPSSEEV